jgi:hypothetical protein
MAAVAEVGADDHVLGLNQLHGHVLVQDVAEALEEVVHRPDPVALEGAPDLADVAILVGRIGHFLQEFMGAEAHLAPDGEAEGQEIASQAIANWLVFGDLKVVRVLQPIGRSH